MLGKPVSLEGNLSLACREINVVFRCGLGGTAPQPEICMFCSLSQNYQHLFEEIIYVSYSKLSTELKNNINI